MTRTQFLSSQAGEWLPHYQSNYRHPKQLPFEVGDVVHLFPVEESWVEIEGTSHWSSKWPHDQNAGVYLIYSASHELLYVGKTSMGQCLGKRLYCHFGGGDVCVVKGKGWNEKPRFVVTIAVPHESPFEAPALEEFLLGKLSPRLNIQGV